MKRLSRILFFCGLLLWAGPVRAQWSGSLELSGGLGATKFRFIEPNILLFRRSQ